jgi:lipoprotein-releasing system permease protein
MMVAEKKKDIAILEVMGMKAKGVTSIFIYQGLFISLFGITGGIALGSLIALHMKKINQAIEELLNSGLFGTAQHYYFYYLPSYYRLQDVLFVALAAFFLCIASAFYPAWQASRIDPVLALND